MVRFGHVHFPVTDLVRSVASSRDRLALPPELHLQRNMAAFAVGLVQDQAEGTTLERLKLQAHMESQPGAEIETVTLALNAEDVDAVYASRQERGIPLGDPPQDQPWGVRNFYIRDPDGYAIEFTQRQKKG